MRPDLDRCAVCGPQLAVAIRIDDEPSHGNRPRETGELRFRGFRRPFRQDDLSWRRPFRACQWTLSQGPDDKCHSAISSPLVSA